MRVLKIAHAIRNQRQSTELAPVQCRDGTICSSVVSPAYGVRLHVRSGHLTSGDAAVWDEMLVNLIKVDRYFSSYNL